MATKIRDKDLKENEVDSVINPKGLPNYDKFPDKPQTDCNLNELQEGSRVIDECHMTESGSDDTGRDYANTVNNLVKDDEAGVSHSGSDVTRYTVDMTEGSPSNEYNISNDIKTFSGTDATENIDTKSTETHSPTKKSTIQEYVTAISSGSNTTRLQTCTVDPAVRDDACNMCGLVSPHLKTCSRCKKMRYCSRDCQRSDWKKHKKTCQAGEGDVDNLIQQLRMSGDLQSITVRPGSKITFPEAKVKAMGIFPGLKIVDKMSELDYRPSKGVFVVKVTGIHINIMKYGICVTDTDDKRLAVMFRVPGDQTLPYFNKDVVTSGSYVCVQGARLHPVQFHLFAPHNVCVMVTDASTVRFLA